MVCRNIITPAPCSDYSWDPKRESIALHFVADAGFRDIASFRIQLGEIDFTRAELNVSGVTLTAIPEPGMYAAVAGVGLCVWAGVRRGRQGPGLNA
jgi:hypothetical protein